MVLPTSNQNNSNDKSAIRKLAENRLKQKASKKVRGLAKKAVKKGAKLAIKAAVKLGAMLGKMLIAGISAIGLPTLLTGFGIIVLVIVISLVASAIFGGGGDELSDDQKEIHNYIVEKSNGSVNMSDPLQAPYRVPEQLISSVIQLDAMTSEDEKEVIDNMANSLKPNFTYDEFNEWKEWKTQVCTDGECEPWSDTHREDNYVDKLTYVDYWNGNTTFTYSPYTTEWETEVHVEYITETETITETVVNEWVEYERVGKRVTVFVPVPRTEYRARTEYRTEKVRMPVDYAPYWIIREIKVPYTVWEEVTVYDYEERTTIVWEQVPVTKREEVEVQREIEIVKEVKTYTKTRFQRFNVTEDSVEDYSTFDSILNSYGLGMNDKRLIEANYMFQDGEIRYTDWLESGGGGFAGGGFDGTIIPGSGVPTQFMAHYRGAEGKYGVDWYTLAAVHFVETGFSTHPTMVSSAGAIGHMQFMPATWVGWKYNIGGGLVSSSLDITSPSVIKSGGGYGVDGDGDGKADPWNVADAIYTAANYLAKSGYATNPRGAIFNYNHADWYVDKVMVAAEKYKTEAVYQPDEGDMPTITNDVFMVPATGPITSPFGWRQNPTNPNQGTEWHQGIDIGKNGRSGNVPIVASADGIVRVSKMNGGGGGYGNYIIITHNVNGKTMETLYGHLQSRAVSAGQTVKKGQFIGVMGTTGRSTGPHLHFEVHEGTWNNSFSNAVNPVKWVNFN